MKKIVSTILLSGMLIAPVRMQAGFTPAFGVRALVPVCKHFGLSIDTSGRIGLQFEKPEVQNLIGITTFALVMGYLIYNKHKLIKPEFGFRFSPNAKA